DQFANCKKLSRSIKMKLFRLGKNISKAKVQDISSHGLWLFVLGREYFLPFSEYPWFSEGRVSDVYTVELVHNQYLRWPKLDVDLALDSLQNPEKYPLASALSLHRHKK